MFNEMHVSDFGVEQSSEINQNLADRAAPKNDIPHFTRTIVPIQVYVPLCLPRFSEISTFLPTHLLPPLPDCTIFIKAFCNSSLYI